MNRILIFCGNYGSGKTEIALNTALNSELPTALMDLDIVNPYFTSSEHKQQLEEKGVAVYSPVYAGTLVDIPALPPVFATLFESDQRQLIVDVGGTETGAVALGGYAERITRTGYEMALVVNILRPFSSTAEEIVTLARQIEEKSRLRITTIINNTNLQLDTTPEQIIEGMQLCEEVAKVLGITVSAVYALPHLIEQLPEAVRVKAHPIRLQMRPEWL